MAGNNKVQDYPLITGAIQAPETLPWATSGTVLEPTPTQEATGWQAAGVGPPVDYRLENYFRDKQGILNARGVETALLVEYARSLVTLTAVDVGVGERELTIAGTTFNHVDALGETTTDVAAVFCAQINAAFPDVFFAEPGAAAGTFYVQLLIPGKTFVITVAVIAGAVNITATTVEDPIVRGYYDATNSAGSLYVDVVLGSTSTEDTGDAAEDRRFVWDKSKGAIRAGQVTAGAWDNANRGDNSTAFGLDCKASGAQSIAAGNASLATGANSIAIGNGNTASTADGCAIGNNNSVTGVAAAAFGSSNTASGIGALAMGAGSTATKQNAVAIGIGNATGIGSVAIGGQGFTTADAHNDDDIAIGTSASANGAGTTGAVAIGVNATASAAAALALGNGVAASQTNAVAIGASATASGVEAVALSRATASATSALASGRGSTASGLGAVALGGTTAGNTMVASGAGARATGSAAVANGVVASGQGATAHGAPEQTWTHNAVTASGKHSDAQGEGVTASGDFSAATGYGAKATNRGEVAHASYDDSDATHDYHGRHQTGLLVAQVRVAAAAALTTLCPDKVDGTGAVTWTPIDDRGYAVRVQAVAKSESSNKCRMWDFAILVTKDAGTTALTMGATMSAPAPALAQVNAATNIAPTVESGWAFGATGPDLQISVAGGTVLLKASGDAAVDCRVTAKIEYTQAGIDY